ncbi:MAG: nucleotidyltransferase domain-containing protein [Candidatus Thorarchaeota archaeon]
MHSINRDKIREDLSFLSTKEVLLYGSIVTGGYGPKSDIDVAIITRTTDPDTHFRTRIEALANAPQKYDIHILEALPIIVIADILNKYEVLFGDPLEIGEYLYYYRKVWEDYKYRLEIPTLEEIKEAFE